MSQFKVPHTLVLLFGMIVLAYFLTLVVPQGQFETRTNEQGREEVIAGSYQNVEKPKLAWYAPLKLVPKGFNKVADIIFFVFIVGGAFGVLRATGAVDALIGALLKVLGDRPMLLIAGGMFIFSAGSSTIGMAEEYLPFVPVLLALCIGLGFDAVVAIGILCVGYGIGYGAAALNPFTVMIAQGVAGLQPGSGAGFRVAIWAVFMIVGIHHVWAYANKVKKDPTKSLVADIEPEEKYKTHNAPPLNGTHIACLITFAIAMIYMVYGIKAHGWYMVELAALFLGLTLLWSIIGRLNPDKSANSFCEGAGELVTTALLIGVANTIEVVLSEGHVVDTIVFAISQPLETLGPTLASVGMFFFQCLCNLFIPSGSGQAFVTMPLMAPLGDLVGVSRQTAVLAYQFGDGFTNILVPTNAVLVGILAMAKIPYDRWLRFILPFMFKVWILGSIALAVAVMIGY